jgi:hypothetical protein
MIVDYTGASPLGDFTTPGTIAYHLASGRSGGTWSGPGIATSLGAPAQTIGYAEASVLFGISGFDTALFNGYTVDATSVLLKYTYYGDADLSGEVDFDDYVRIDGGFNSELTGWTNGDFDYSGDVGFDDFVLIDLGFNLQSGTLRRAQAYLSGDDRSRNGMDVPALQKVEAHFAQFGVPYARNFLAAVPEPGMVGLFAIPAVLARRRRR